VKGLYADGHYVIFGSRNQQRNQSAVNEVKAAYPNSTGQIKSFQLDLSKRASVEEFAKQVKT
jgi:NAD(P)-dependent dehydrogenase (short-subunit alcohol dehydrogenase family)